MKPPVSPVPFVRLAVTVLATALWGSVSAQTLKRIDADAERVGINEPAGLRIEFEPYTGSARCAFHISYGDGEEEDVPVEKLPVLLEKRYARAATYVVSVKGKTRMRGIFNVKPACEGPGLTTTLTVFDRAAEEAEQRRKAELDKHEAALAEERARLRRERRELEAAQQRASEAAAAKATAKPPATAASAKGVTRPK